MDNKHTIMFSSLENDEQKTPKEILTIVYEALEDRGYNPIDQIVGFILSGDPSYITSHNGARNLIRKLDRDDLAEELVRSYLGK